MYCGTDIRIKPERAMFFAHRVNNVTKVGNSISIDYKTTKC